MRWRRRTGERNPVGEAVTAADVELLYSELLGRSPSDEEIALQLATALDLRTLVQVVLGSEEYLQRRTAAPFAMPHVVNAWHVDFAAYTHPTGTWSPDGVAVMGRAGWVFLGTGTNAVMDQYRGDVVLPDHWEEHWTEAAALRRQQTADMGAAFAAIIVPDKLAVLTEHMPATLPPDVQPPAAVLAQLPELGVLHPVQELSAVADGAYLRTDTHLTYAGNAALARVVLAELDVDPAAADVDVAMVRYPSSGDLGNRFLPPVVEVITTASTLGAATIVEDNHEPIRAAGGHIGTRRVLRNEAAADPRTVVLFGDSYGFPAPHYQGTAWFLAQAFREVHFVWVPFGWDREYVERAGAQVVVCEAAERFVVRPPALEVDVADLEALTLAHGGGAAAAAVSRSPTAA